MRLILESHSALIWAARDPKSRARPFGRRVSGAYPDAARRLRRDTRTPRRWSPKPGRVGPGTVGIGMPGTISPATGLVKNADRPLNGRPLETTGRRARTRGTLPTTPTTCAVSRRWAGAGAGSLRDRRHRNRRRDRGDGKVLIGANAIGGEWGHNPMPWPEPRSGRDRR